jgi:hypothetical protein
MFFTPIPPLETTQIIQAYLDPVSSGAILQTLLAILLGASLFLRAFWRKISALYTQIKSKLTKKTGDAPVDIMTKSGE